MRIIVRRKQNEPLFFEPYIKVMMTWSNGQSTVFIVKAYIRFDTESKEFKTGSEQVLAVR